MWDFGTVHQCNCSWSLSLYTHAYIYIHVFAKREREREKKRENNQTERRRYVYFLCLFYDAGPSVYAGVEHLDIGNCLWYLLTNYLHHYPSRHSIFRTFDVHCLAHVSHVMVQRSASSNRHKTAVSAIRLLYHGCMRLLHGFAFWLTLHLDYANKSRRTCGASVRFANALAPVLSLCVHIHMHTHTCTYMYM